MSTSNDFSTLLSEIEQHCSPAQAWEPGVAFQLSTLEASMKALPDSPLHVSLRGTIALAKAIVETGEVSNAKGLLENESVRLWQTHDSLSLSGGSHAELSSIRAVLCLIISLRQPPEEFEIVDALGWFVDFLVETGCSPTEEFLVSQLRRSFAVLTTSAANCAPQ